MLEMLLHATEIEFCNQYSTFCQEKNSEISANGFLSWMGNIENEFINLL